MMKAGFELRRSITLLGLAATVACATDVTDPGAEIDPRYAKGGSGGGAPTGSTVTVTPSGEAIVVGSTLQMMAVVSNSKGVQEKTVLWSTSNPLVATVDQNGLVSGIAAGGPVTITATTEGKKSVAGNATVTVVSSDPTWSTLVTPEEAPGAPIFRSTSAPSDEALYAIIGNGDYQPLALWRFDLTTDTWSLVPTTNSPLGKYRQIVHDPLNHRILTYWDGIGQVYAVSELGGAWQAVGSTSNSDSWYEGASFWNTVSGRLSVFAGYGGGMWKNSLFSFNQATSAWDLESQSAVKPDPRFAISAAVDEAGGSFFINSGEGSPSGSQIVGARVYNDLWKLDLASNTWTQLIAHDGNPAPTIGAGMDFVASKNVLYRFGGSHGARNPNYLNDLEIAELGSATISWAPVATTGSAPSPRNSAGVYYDTPRRRLIVVGGQPLTGTLKLDVYALGQI